MQENTNFSIFFIDYDYEVMDYIVTKGNPLTTTTTTKNQLNANDLFEEKKNHLK